MSAGQLHRFRSEMKIGDYVVTYDPSRRVYLVGEIAGDYRWDPRIDPDDPNVRSVTWQGEVSRDRLSVRSRNSLGAISTLFQLSPDVVEDLLRALASLTMAITFPLSRRASRWSAHQFIIFTRSSQCSPRS